MFSNDGSNLRMETQVSRSNEQVSADLEGDSIILNVNSGKYYSLNPVGARVWKLIETPISLENIHTALLNEYNVESERCKQDLFHLMQKLVDAGLVLVIDKTERKE